MKDKNVFYTSGISTSEGLLYNVTGLTRHVPASYTVIWHIFNYRLWFQAFKYKTYFVRNKIKWWLYKKKLITAQNIASPLCFEWSL